MALTIFQTQYQTQYQTLRYQLSEVALWGECIRNRFEYLEFTIDVRIANLKSKVDRLAKKQIRRRFLYARLARDQIPMYYVGSVMDRSYLNTLANPTIGKRRSILAQITRFGNGYVGVSLVGNLHGFDSDMRVIRIEPLSQLIGHNEILSSHLAATPDRLALLLKLIDSAEIVLLDTQWKVCTRSSIMLSTNETVALEAATFEVAIVEQRSNICHLYDLQGQKRETIRLHSSNLRLSQDVLCTWDSHRAVVCDRLCGDRQLFNTPDTILDIQIDGTILYFLLDSEEFDSCYIAAYSLSNITTRIVASPLHKSPIFHLSLGPGSQLLVGGYGVCWILRLESDAEIDLDCSSLWAVDKV